MTNPTRSKPLVFSLTEDEAVALIEFGAALEAFVTQKSPLDTATQKIDEQLAQQRMTFECCPTCEGSGWVEDGTVPDSQIANPS